MQERGLAFSATKIAPKLILLGFICVIVAFGMPSEFSVLLIISTLALGTSMVVFMWLVHETWIKSLKKSVNYKLLNSMLKFSVPLVAGGLAYWGLTTMDRLYLRVYSGFEELGVYALSVSLAATVSVVSSVFSSLWHPIVYKWVKIGIEPRKVQAVSEFMLLLIASIWTAAGLFSWVLLYFLPKDYAAIEYLIVACVAMPLLYMLSETTVVGIGITRRSSFSMLASLFAFLINAVLNYLFIPEYGASGAALASVAAFFVFFAIRTEASAFLWESFPRVKIYIVAVMYISATFLIVLMENKVSYFYYIWLILLLVTTAMFWARVNQAYSFMKICIMRKI
jgi:O-antigen/teichoic acid export membrane protein